MDVLYVLGWLLLLSGSILLRVIIGKHLYTRVLAHYEQEKEQEKLSAE